MTHICFEEHPFRPKSKKQIAQANEIIAEYPYQLTLRQLYYRFVARGILPNTAKDKKYFLNLMSRAIASGLIEHRDLSLNPFWQETNGNVIEVWCDNGPFGSFLSTALKTPVAIISFDKFPRPEQIAIGNKSIRRKILVTDMSGYSMAFRNRFDSIYGLWDKQLVDQNPSPNPSAKRDKRFPEYGRGDCWELDSLDPKWIADSIDSFIAALE